jgi:competence ComEA-like helix-hairpin-helix protein
MDDNAFAEKTNASDSAVMFAGLVAASVVALLGACIFAFCCPCSDSEIDFNLDGRINANTASAGELTQLPRIGPKTAQAIIEYRNGFQGQFAFENIEDLQKVKGIGPKTTEGIKQWLIFE